MRSIRRAGLAVAAAALLVGCTSAPGGSAAPAAHAPALAGQPMATCTISGEVPVKASFPAYCGTLQVPEDRSNPSGRQIGLRVAVVPAVAADAKPDPLFALAGGPGDASTSFFAWLPGLYTERPRHPRHRPRRPARHRRLEPADPARHARHDGAVRRRGRRAPVGLGEGEPRRARRRPAHVYEHRGSRRPGRGPGRPRVRQGRPVRRLLRRGARAVLPAPARRPRAGRDHGRHDAARRPRPGAHGGERASTRSTCCSTGAPPMQPATPPSRTSRPSGRRSWRRSRRASPSRTRTRGRRGWPTSRSWGPPSTTRS